MKKAELIDLLKDVVQGADWYYDRGEVPDEENPRIISGDLYNQIKDAVS